MLTERDIRDILCSVLKSEDARGWATDFDFREDALDSLDVVTFGLKLEEAAGIKVTDQELSEMTTIGKVVAFLRAKGA